MSRVPDNAEITTIEGVGTISDMHPIQVAWMAYGCAQCGFCSPGFIISAKVLLDNNPSPTREEVREWFNKQRNLVAVPVTSRSSMQMAAQKLCVARWQKRILFLNRPVILLLVQIISVHQRRQKVTGTWDFGADDVLKMPEGTLPSGTPYTGQSFTQHPQHWYNRSRRHAGVPRVITAKDIKARRNKQD